MKKTSKSKKRKKKNRVASKMLRLKQQTRCLISPVKKLGDTITENNILTADSQVTGGALLYNEHGALANIGRIEGQALKGIFMDFLTRGDFNGFGWAWLGAVPALNDKQELIGFDYGLLANSRARTNEQLIANIAADWAKKARAFIPDPQHIQHPGNPLYDESMDAKDKPDLPGKDSEGVQNLIYKQEDKQQESPEENPIDTDLGKFSIGGVEPQKQAALIAMNRACYDFVNSMGDAGLAGLLIGELPSLQGMMMLGVLPNNLALSYLSFFLELIDNLPEHLGVPSV